MPKSTFREDTPYPIPTDTLVPVVLLSVQEIDVPFTYKQGPKQGTQGSFRKWEWNTQVIDGEYNGIEVRGSTEPQITNASEQTNFLALALPYVEAFLGRGLQIGEEVDTDHLIGLYAYVTVKHLPPRQRRDGEGFWHNVEVEDIFPYQPSNGGQPAGPQNMQDALLRPGSDEPPF